MSFHVPPADNRERHVCGHCGEIHYRNPRIVAGCLLNWDDRILLARRSIEPRSGYWTLPAGFMELGESTAEAAARESEEEALASPQNMQLYAIYSLPHIGQVYLMYRAELKQGQYGVGEESSEVELFLEEDIPWNELAFPIVHRTLERYLEDRIEGQFSLIEETIERRPDFFRR